MTMELVSLYHCINLDMGVSRRKCKGKGKGIPIIGHEGPRGMWMQGSTYSQPRH